MHLIQTRGYPVRPKARCAASGTSYLVLTGVRNWKLVLLKT